ncbi:VCBS repeat-containing protein [Marinobacter salinisoli]|uniref:VCBS repeat-containing protein n=1 Tax=Marinobacter salinisoli TaxID=2769486 RepID=A0ABX7MVQ6_9GAMM|nr:FG-GAP-like repeat-containing protein [Marinobacter salinisoli]QSP95540.1 VCBS repeat-containing protein [Marinobacter salinisoli]
MNKEKSFISGFGPAIVLIVFLLTLGSTQPVDIPDPPAYGPSDHASPEIPRFLEKSLELGIQAFHHDSADYLSGLDQTLGGGTCVLDYNNDGWLDLLIIGGSGQVRHYGKDAWWSDNQPLYLYQNNHGRYFSDVTSFSELTTTEKGMGCAAADLDNDTHTDLVITTTGKNHIFRNTGDGRFEDVTEQSGLSETGWSTSVTIADYDRDGHKDIYVANYIDYEKGGRRFESNWGFKSLSPSDFNPSLFDPLPNKLYRNTGGMKFMEVGTESGVEDRSGRSLSAQWVDINRDFWPDLLVVNHTGSPNRLYLNKRDGTFEEHKTAIGISGISATQSSAVADFDSDGDFDIFLTAATGHAPGLAFNERKEYVFNDRIWSKGISDHHLISSSGWGVLAEDLNNDGVIDFVLNNGNLTPDVDSPSVPQGQPNSIWLGRKDGRYDIEKAFGALSGRGLASFDFDNDGDSDLVFVNNNDRVELWENLEAKNNWIGISLDSPKGSEAENATVEVRANGKVYKQSARIPSTFLSQSDPRLRFGLGSIEEIDQILIHWADGIQKIEEFQINKYLKITKGNSRTEVIHPEKQSDVSSDETHNLSISTVLEQVEQVFFSQEDIQGLLATYDRSAETSRLDFLEKVSELPNRISLPFLQRSLRSSSQKEVIAGLRLAKRLESEASITWLLPLFDSDVPEIKCAVSSVFEHFFREEEAVVRRKMRAVSYLVRLLDETEQAVVQCALRALAESEHYRAVAPAIRLAQSENPDVREEAVRALGLLREKKALPVLVKLYEDPEQSPSLKAAVLSALSRLGRDPFTMGMLDAEKFIHSSEQKREFLAVVRELRAGDYLALGFQRLQDSLSKFLEITSLPSNVYTMELATYAITEFRNQKAQEQLHKLLDKYSTQVPSILASALSIDGFLPSEAVIVRLLEQPADIRRSVAEQADLMGLKVDWTRIPWPEAPTEDELYFAVRALHSNHPATFRSEVLNEALQFSNSESVQKVALSQCSNLRPRKLIFPESLLISQSEGFLELALRCLDNMAADYAEPHIRRSIGAIAKSSQSTFSEVAYAARVLVNRSTRAGLSLGVDLINGVGTRPEFLSELVRVLVEQKPRFAPILLREIAKGGSLELKALVLEQGGTMLPEKTRLELSEELGNVSEGAVKSKEVSGVTSVENSRFDFKSTAVSEVN